MKKTILDDGFQAYLTEGATLVGDAGIPMLLDLKNTQIPKGLVPFNKIGIEKNKNKYGSSNINVGKIRYENI